jgi:hypothetical protein
MGKFYIFFRLKTLITFTPTLWEKNFRIFQDAADQMLPVAKFSKIYNWKINLSYPSRKVQLHVTFGLLLLCFSENPGYFGTGQVFSPKRSIYKKEGLCSAMMKSYKKKFTSIDPLSLCLSLSFSSPVSFLLHAKYVKSNKPIKFLRSRKFHGVPVQVCKTCQMVAL